MTEVVEHYSEKFEDLFEIGKELGNGSFSHVFQVKSKTTGQQFAAKIMDKTLLGPIKMELVSTEVKIMKNLKHPNILRLYELFDSDTRFILILELLSGGSALLFS